MRELDEGAHRITQISQQSMENTILAWHYIFGGYTTRTQSYQSSSLLMHRATVEVGFEWSIHAMASCREWRTVSCFDNSELFCCGWRSM